MNMKKYLLLSAVACTLAGCSNDFNPADVVVDKGSNTETKEAPIGFSATNKNMLREAPGLEQSHYNFGVFAYKNTDDTNPIMADYLVGYMDATGKNGYKLTTGNQTTLGDANSTTNRQSQWAYEKLGWTNKNAGVTNEYNVTSNAADEHYYLSNTDDPFYMSNNTNQYLRYWDYSSASTNFYAYAPYYHPTSGDKVKFDKSTHTLTLPVGAIKAGNDDATKYEAMYAATNVAKENYGKEGQLQFKRLVSKIKIGFYEDIEGYGVTIEPLKTGFDIVSAVPATQETPYHKYANMLKTAGITLTFTGAEFVTVPTITPENFTGSYYTKNEANDYTGEYLSFVIPEGAASAGTGNDEPEKRIATSKATMTPTDYSKTEYYGIPKNTNVGLTFHVSFKLHSTTGETILVKDATVWVPGTACQWEPNKQYTYIFKITKKTTGTTENIDDASINPGSSKVNEKALYPIVFDGCTVEDWETVAETEHPIN